MNRKTFLIAAALMLTLLLAILPAACADIYLAPSTVQAGSELNHLLATVDSDTVVTFMDNSVPDGVAVVAENGQNGLDVFLRGVPQLAGEYNVVLDLGESGSYSYALEVEPASPVINSISSDVICAPNEEIQLVVSAYASDGGTLSYQWFFGQQPGSGTAIAGGNYEVLTIYTTPGVSYYYCVVTNTNNGMSAQTISKTISVTVENSVSSIGISSWPYKTDYIVGEMLDTTGLQLTVNYLNGSTQTIDSGFTAYPLQFETAGEQPISIEYNGYVCFYSVNVRSEAEVVTGIGILALPSRLRYTVGEYLDTTGLKVRIQTSQGYRDVEASEVVCSPMALNTTGEQDILVSYGDKSCTFTVTILDPERPVSLSVETMPAKSIYTVGQNLDSTGLVLKQITNWQNAQYIYSGYTCTPIQMSNVGRQQITVSYGDLSTTFTVTVTEAHVTPVPTATPLPASVPTPVPSSMPTAVPTSIPTSIPTSVPTSVPSVNPAATRSTGHSAHQTNLGRTLIGVIVITALAALGVLGVYVFVMNQGGFDEAWQKLKELFGQDKGGKHRK